MESKKIIFAAVATLAYVTIILRMRHKRCQKKRSVWCKKWLKRREEGKGALSLLNSELRLEDPNAYKNFLRLDDANFAMLLELIESDIKREDTFMREAISAKHRLDITLRFLATGESYRSLMYSMRVHESTISLIVPQVCSAIYKALKRKYLKTPSSEEDWSCVANRYEEKWNFPNCLGALDGRHITFCAPISTGSYYYNYKQTSSIVLLGLVDADYKFIYANVGVNGRISDGGVFEESNLCKMLKQNKLKIPQPRYIPGLPPGKSLPYVFIADDAFPLMENLMKPFSQRNLTYHCRIFNYRLSRARRMVESSFGILANRWRVLLNPINLHPDKVEVITLACLVLHNFVAAHNSEYIDDIESTEKFLLTRVNGQYSNNASSTNARAVREDFKAYFNTVGVVSWQDDAVKRGS